MIKRENEIHKTENKREFIIRIAMQLFKEKGYKNVSVDEIVQACNSSKGSFYHHFKSKAEILNEHFALADKYYEQLYNDLPIQLSPKRRLQLFLENVFIYLEETFGREFLSVVYSTSLESEAHLYFRNPNRKLFMLFGALITEVIEASPTKPALSLKQLKLAFTQLAMGVIYHWCTFPEDQSLQESGASALQHYLSGFS
ncbi:TetR/AcrR family transcriptional regulator [Solibacillus silvestris]